MGLHSCERMKERDTLRKEDARYLVEYVRKIYDACSADLIEQVESCVYDLPIHGEDGEASQVLHIVVPKNGHIRDASFVVDGYSSEGDRQFYEFSMGNELSMNKDRGSSYEEVSLQDDDRYRAAFRDVSHALLSTGVETPQITPAEEAVFWDIALETCYEEIDERAERDLWEDINTTAPTHNLKEMLHHIDNAREMCEMALGVQAITSVFSATGATKEEMNHLYWRHALRQYVGSKRQ